MLRRIAAMPPKVIAEKALCRSIRLMDHPISILESMNNGFELSERSSYSDRRVLREFRQCLQNGDQLVIYDIGANRGNYARSLAKSSKVATIIAFEPLPNEFKMLQDAANATTKIKAINLALGNETGHSAFHQNTSSASSSILRMLPEHVKQFPHTAVSNEITVPVARLDDVVRDLSLPFPDVIKVDVQGYEDKVLAGGAKTVKHAQWLVLELSFVPLYQGSVEFDGLYSEAIKHGFQLVEITDQLLGGDGNPLQVNALFRRKL